MRNLLSAAAVADYTQDPQEGQIARTIFDLLQADFEKNDLVRILTWIIITPDQGTVVVDAPEVGINGPVNEDVVRARVLIYAQKLLGAIAG